MRNGLPSDWRFQDEVVRLEEGERVWLEYENEEVLNFNAPDIIFWPLYHPDTWQYKAWKGHPHE